MGQAMIALVVLVILYTAFLYVSAPGFIGPMLPEPPVWSYAFAAIGVLGLIVGLVWMVRIYRGDPEPDQHAWRYRAKR
jgi:hypothetical protein